MMLCCFFFFFQAEDGIRDHCVTGVQTCALPIYEVVGFALYFRNFSTWEGVHGIYLEDLYVMPEYRGSGLGRALLASLAGLAIERGYARLEWAVLDWNQPAIDFYRSLGAVAMEEWTVYRLSGEALAAASAAP